MMGYPQVPCDWLTSALVSVYGVGIRQQVIGTVVETHESPQGFSKTNSKIFYAEVLKDNKLGIFNGFSPFTTQINLILKMFSRL